MYEQENMNRREIQTNVFAKERPLHRLISSLSPERLEDRRMAAKIANQAERLAEAGEIPPSFKRQVFKELRDLKFKI